LAFALIGYDVCGWGITWSIVSARAKGLTEESFVFDILVDLLLWYTILKISQASLF